MLLVRANMVPRMKRCVIGSDPIPDCNLNFTARPRTRKRADKQKRSKTATRPSVSHAPFRRQSVGNWKNDAPISATGRREGRSPARSARTNAHRQDSLETAGITRAPIACGATCTGLQSLYLSHSLYSSVSFPLIIPFNNTNDNVSQ